MDKRKIIYAPRAQRDLGKIEKDDALRILADIEILMNPPWPSGKVKKLRGVDYWEIKTGNYRTIFWTQKNTVVILRVVNRRDLEDAIERIDVRALLRWMRQRDKE